MPYWLRRGAAALPPLPGNGVFRGKAMQAQAGVFCPKSGLLTEKKAEKWEKIPLTRVTVHQ